MKPVSAAIWAIVLLCAGTASAESFEQIRAELAHDLLHHTVYLHHANRATYLHFDEHGRLLNHGRPGYWAESSAVYVLKLDLLPPAALHIEGERVAVVFDHHKGRWEGIRRGATTVVIEIDFTPSQLTMEHARSTVSDIFARSIEELASDTLPYWRPCIEGVMKTDPAMGGRYFCFDKDVSPDMRTHAPVHTDIPQEGGMIVPTQRVKAPNPRFTEVAREQGFNGMCVLWLIVDEEGRPAEIYVASPVGYGLDDEAVNAIANWRFRPATLRGRPVRVQMTIEVNFKVPAPRRVVRH